MQNEDEKKKRYELINTSDQLLHMNIRTTGDIINFHNGVTNLGGIIASNTGLLTTLQNPNSIGFSSFSPSNTQPQSKTAVFFYNAKNDGSPTHKMDFGNIGQISHGYAAVLSYSEVNKGLKNDSALTFTIPNSKIKQDQVYLDTNNIALNGLNRSLFIDMEVLEHKFPYAKPVPGGIFTGVKTEYTTLITSPFVYTPKVVKLESIFSKIPALEAEIKSLKEKYEKSMLEMRKILEIAYDKTQKTHGKNHELEKLFLRQQEEIDEMKINIQIVQNSQIGYINNEDEVQIGTLSYKNKSIFYKNSALKGLSPQMIRLCHFFIIWNKDHDEFVTDKRLCEIASKSSPVSKKNLAKLISHIRTLFRTYKINIVIKRHTGEGYTVIMKNIR